MGGYVRHYTVISQHETKRIIKISQTDISVPAKIWTNEAQTLSKISYHSVFSTGNNF